jgi:hypothetical protein
MITEYSKTKQIPNIKEKEWYVSVQSLSDYNKEEQKAILENSSFLKSLEKGTGFKIRMYLTKQEEEFKDTMKDKFSIYIGEHNKSSSNDIILVSNVDNFSFKLSFDSIKLLLKENEIYNLSNLSNTENEFTDSLNKFISSKHMVNNLHQSLKCNAAKPKRKFKV